MKAKFVIARSPLFLGAILLSASAVEATPIAVLDAIPNPTVIGLPVQFDFSGSYDNDPSKSLVLFELDFEGDGTFDFSTSTASTTSHAYSALGTFNTTLRVTNDANAETDFTTLTVNVINPPHPPVADANGPYIFEIGSGPFWLDGSGSYDIDEGLGDVGAPGDLITEYAWELDGVFPYDFAEAFGVQPDVTAFYTALGPGTYTAGLRVTDNTGLSFPSSGRSNLTDSTFTTVQVISSQGTAPEPSSIALLSLGLAGISHWRRKKIKAA